MNLTETAYGTWSGGRFMHFGETLSEERFIQCLVCAYESGVRTFVTSDVYGNGKADELLGKALRGIPRENYALVGMIGHDFYEGQRQGSKGYPRFTDPSLRKEKDFHDFVAMATSKSLERCETSYFDLLMLHNPDEIGYTNEALWLALADLKQTAMVKQLGIAPGPANGFTLDFIASLENFGEYIDWSMLILNPLEPWPVGLVLPICDQFNVKVMTRVVDYGGLFHGDVKDDQHIFKPGDHRTYRPQGWVGKGMEKIEKMQPIAEKYGLDLLQLACIWNLSQSPVESVIPTFIQEAGEDAIAIEEKIKAYAVLPDIRLSAEDVEAIRQIGDNTGCMTLKGASKRHQSSERADEWSMRPDLIDLAQRYNLGLDW